MEGLYLCICEACILMKCVTVSHCQHHVAESLPLQKKRKINKMFSVEEENPQYLHLHVLVNTIKHLIFPPAHPFSIVVH